MRQNGTASDERWLVTGALGCVGAWTVRALVREGAQVIGYDRPGEPHRLRLVMSDDELDRVTLVPGDITDLDHLQRTMQAHDIDRVVHLAALQVPTVRSDPPRGAMVNVVGTVNVFEAVKARIAQGGRMGPVVYAGSVGMFDAADADPVNGRLHVDAAAHPPTHYGVFKLANEGNARVYWRDDGIPSVGLRPMTVYGPGRDQGMTSGPTKAILAAVAGVPYRIPFGNRTLLQYAEDVARALVAAGRSNLGGAQVVNLGGSLASMSELIAAIEAELPHARGLVTFDAQRLPFPEAVDTDGLETLGDVAVTPLGDAVHRTIEIFRSGLASGRLDLPMGGVAPAAHAAQAIVPPRAS